MLELSCSTDYVRRFAPIEQFIAIGCEKTSRALGQQVKSDCALGDGMAFQFRQHGFT